MLICFFDQKGTVHKKFVPPGQTVQTLEEIQAESQTVLNTLQDNDFQECFKNWQPSWDHCQASDGDYCEGDAGP